MAPRFGSDKAGNNKPSGAEVDETSQTVESRSEELLLPLSAPRGVIPQMAWSPLPFKQTNRLATCLVFLACPLLRLGLKHARELTRTVADLLLVRKASTSLAWVYVLPYFTPFYQKNMMNAV